MQPPAHAAQLSMALPAYAAEDPGTWQHLFDTACAADLAGVDRVVMSDHVVYGENLEAYARPELGGIAGGRQPTGPDGHWLEPITTLSVLAGMTKRVRLGTNIIIAALRRPVILAKSAATLDVLSGGRLDLGVGVGWQREEYDAAGLDFAERGRLLDQTLEVCQELWTSGRASVTQPGLAFDAIHMMPKPLQPGGVPIWVSGRLTPRVVRRLARFGRGWIPWDVGAAEFGTAVAVLREQLAAAGRDPAGMGVVASVRAAHAEGRFDASRFADQAGAMIEAGATDIRIGTWRAPGGKAELTDQLAEIVAAFRAAVRSATD
jgi:probable F420-dependent oxidoreductase